MLSIVRRAVRWAARQWWASVRPSAPSLDTASHGDAVTVVRGGHTPSPDDRFLPTSEPTGPFAEIDPARTGAWLGRPGVLAGAAWMGAVALSVRRRLR